ncbi:hypothetical protein ACHAWC_008606 [Mediolabrus comicus]
MKNRSSNSSSCNKTSGSASSHSRISSSSSDRILHLVTSLFIYLLSIAIYIHPLTLSPTPSSSSSSSINKSLQQQQWTLITNPQPQLDELHIMSPQNHDISPPPPLSTSTTNDNNNNNNSHYYYQWMEAWHNDYWGRPLSGESSHKSWRPITVWSFRFFKCSSNNNNGSSSATVAKYGKIIFGLGGRAFGTIVELILNLAGVDKVVVVTAATTVTLGSIFRYDKDELASTSELFIHRFVNVLIHASLVQLVGVVAKLLFFGTASDTTSTAKKQQTLQQQYTQYTSQILFALHPVHVEAVANAANRPHILALLFNVTIIDPSIPFVMVGLLGVLGLLSSETAIFQYPAIVLMMTVIQYQREKKRKNKDAKTKEKKLTKNDIQSSSSASILLKTFFTLLPRYILLIMTSTSYLLYRYINGSLTIPDGLIRPAENPFYNKVDSGEWTIQQRIINYSYILSLHIMKSFGVEMIGYSHEYGFDCIPEIRLPIVQQTSSSSWSMDVRVLLPIALLVFFVGLTFWSWNGGRQQQKDNMLKSKKQQQDDDRIQRMLLLLTFFAWLATLFPIAGFLKVGTFVADRLVVASTFGTCIFAGRIIASWLTSDDNNDNNTSNEHRPSLAIRPKTVIKHTILLYICTNHLAKQTHQRTSEWMDAYSLMTSSLKTCPRSIKTNLETSKLYSGLVPHMLDLEKALSLIENAQSIDPTYCDVHMQYAHVYFQQEKYLTSL